jgi:glutathione synthase/RimK-type ligase-like ATP-grasp enzyme
MILILSSRDDVHAVRVLARLKRRGVRARVLDPSDLPRDATVSARLGARAPRLAWKDADGAIDLVSVSTVWLRRLRPTKLDPGLSAGDASFAGAETHHALAGLGRLLDGARWVNPLVSGLATDGGHGKLHQLEVARALELEIPETLCTNDPAEARAFVESCELGAIYKPFLSPEREGPDGQKLVIFTREVTDEQRSRLDAVRLAPCLFQERVAKRVEVRATVLGDRVLACEIHSQGQAETRVDFRRRYKGTRFAPHKLPAGVEHALVKLHRRLGLVFGCADLIVTPEGRYVFLETNQAGQWLWCEERAGIPVLDAFCDLLTDACGAPGR